MNQKVRMLVAPGEDEMNDAIREEAELGFKVQSINIETIRQTDGTIPAFVIILFEKK